MVIFFCCSIISYSLIDFAVWKPEEEARGVDKKILLVVAVVGFILAVLVLRPKNARRSGVENAASTSSAIVPNSKNGSVSTVPQTETWTAEPGDSKNSVPMAPAIGAAYVKDEKGRRYLSINLSPLKQCHKGDADSMLTLASTYGSSLIATLEPIDFKDNGKAVVKELTESDFDNGTDFGFEVKEDSPKAFAIYICSDGARTKSCRKKPPARLVFGHESFVSTLESSSEKDFVFFVHLLILDKQNYQVYQSNFEAENVRSAIAAALNKASLSGEELQRANEITKLLKTIRPYPIAVKNDGGVGSVLGITITRQDSRMCRD